MNETTTSENYEQTLSALGRLETSELRKIRTEIDRFIKKKESEDTEAAVEELKRIALDKGLTIQQVVEAATSHDKKTRRRKKSPSPKVQDQASTQ